MIIMILSFIFFRNLPQPVSSAYDYRGFAPSMLTWWPSYHMIPETLILPLQTEWVSYFIKHFNLLSDAISPNSSISPKACWMLMQSCWTLMLSRIGTFTVKGVAFWFLGREGALYTWIFLFSFTFAWEHKKEFNFLIFFIWNPRSKWGGG